MIKNVFFILILTLLVPRAAISSSSGIHSLLNEKMELVTQFAGGSRACGPTALLYSLKLGNRSMKDVYAKISGTDDKSKLQNIIKTFGAKPSKTKFHEKRLESNDGMAPLDVFATANDLFEKPALQFVGLERSVEEKDPGNFLKRIHSSFKTSLTKNVPIIVVTVPYAASYSPTTQKSMWKEHNGHYIVVTGITSELGEQDLGFTLEYLDPETGKPHQAYLHEEVLRNFWARKEHQEKPSEWIHPQVNFKNKNVESPYLVLTAPGLNLVPQNIKDAERVVITIPTAIGNFDNSTATIKSL